MILIAPKKLPSFHVVWYQTLLTEDNLRQIRKLVRVGAACGKGGGRRLLTIFYYTADSQHSCNSFVLRSNIYTKSSTAC